LLRYSDFFIFQDGGRHLGFSKCRNFQREGSRGTKCAAVPNFAVISQTTAGIWGFLFFKMAADAILDF